MNKIIFSNINNIDFFPPKPAIKDIPDWYLNNKEYVNDIRQTIDGGTPHTIKKCIPIFDSMTAGYILYTQVDVEVTQRDGSPFFAWPSQDAISFHSIKQAELHPERHNDKDSFPKWTNPYAIKTPKGYSSLFISPMHGKNNIFKILPGIVDTDNYDAPVNFPFLLKDQTWEGIIPAGTPMAQVIPFKRESWKMEIGNHKDLERQFRTTAKLKTLLYNSYKKNFWARKEYR